MKINFLKNKKSFKKGSPVINPDIYWDSMLVGIGALVCVAGLFGCILFNQVNKEITSPTAQTSAKNNTLNKNRIDKVLKYFSDREERSAVIINSGADIVDPSL